MFVKVPVRIGESSGEILFSRDQVVCITMRATLTDNDGTELEVEVPSQRAFSDYIIYDDQIYRRVGSVVRGEFQEVSGRVVIGTTIEKDAD